MRTQQANKSKALGRVPGALRSCPRPHTPLPQETSDAPLRAVAQEETPGLLSQGLHACRQGGAQG